MSLILAALLAETLAATPAPTPAPASVPVVKAGTGQTRTLADVARERKLGVKGSGTFSATESSVSGGAVSEADVKKAVDALSPASRVIYYDCKTQYGVGQRFTDCVAAGIARQESRRPMP